jgi:hypothetical protein
MIKKGEGSEERVVELAIKAFFWIVIIAWGVSLVQNELTQVVLAIVSGLAIAIGLMVFSKAGRLIILLQKAVLSFMVVGLFQQKDVYDLILCIGAWSMIFFIVFIKKVM